jgi:hypothetical protein
MRTLLRVLAFFAAGIVGCAAGAACNPDHFSTFGSSYTYLYVRGVATESATAGSVIGHFWSPGAFATTGEQQCDETYWLHRTFPVTPPTWYVDGTLNAMGCVSGCPGNEMILTVEDFASGGSDAVFAAARIDKTPATNPQYDFSRLERDIALVQIPAPIVVASTTGEVFDAHIIVPDPAAGFFGLPGVPATSTITAFWIHADDTPVSRDRSTWSFVKRVPYSGGSTAADVTLLCNLTGRTYIAAAVEFDNGQVVTNYVSRNSTVECDTYAAGAGAVRDGGPNGLFVRRQASGDLTLTWGPSCSVGDQGFELYEGVLGDWTSHSPRSCSTGSGTTFTPSPLDSYYLVVTFEDTYEGSYGHRSGAEERPLGASACRPKAVNLCPP